MSQVFIVAESCFSQDPSDHSIRVEAFPDGPAAKRRFDELVRSDLDANGYYMDEFGYIRDAHPRCDDDVPCSVKKFIFDANLSGEYLRQSFGTSYLVKFHRFASWPGYS